MLHSFLIRKEARTTVSWFCRSSKTTLQWKEMCSSELKARSTHSGLENVVYKHGLRHKEHLNQIKQHNSTVHHNAQ